MTVPVPLLFLDLDGTVRKGFDELGRFVNGPDDVEVFPEAFDRMRKWKAAGGRIIAVTNAGGIALGKADAEKVHDAIIKTAHDTDGLFDLIDHCPHHPEADHPEWARCWCRKPHAGMLIRSAEFLAHRFTTERYPAYMALMVGDRDEDRQAAAAAGVDFQWAAEWRAGT